MPGGLLVVSVSPEGLTLIDAHLSGILFQEDGQWICYCEHLQTATCGLTQQAALDNMREAIQLFLDSCMDRGTLDQALEELNWTRRQGEIDLDGLVRRHVSAGSAVPENTPPAFIVDKLRPTNRTWSGMARYRGR